MHSTIKWSSYIRLALLMFCAFLLEYLAIFIIEVQVLKFDIANYTANQRSIHHIITVGLWMIYISSIIWYSKQKLSFPTQHNKFKASTKNWLIVLFCLIACKIMTFIDWHTLKIIGEAQGKDIFQFLTQYMYYIMEIIIVLYIVMFGQKASELYLTKESNIPFGGILLACTWGIFHFVSRGVGIEIWNGISCMLFSILSGIIYVRLGKDARLSYVLIAIGYLL